MGKTMDKMLPGEQVVTEKLSLSDPLAESFRRLGLTEGTTVACLRYCPFGGPGLYQVRGACLAIRREDARQISIRGLG